jgi:hypothetical protein
MWKPSYYETPDEKRLAAIRANPSGLPVRQVRPMLPNNYDATGGKDKWGTPKTSISQYLENNRKMYTLEDVPSAAPAPVSRWEAPKLDASVKIARKYGGQEQATATEFQGLRGNRWGASGGIGPQGDFRFQPYVVESPRPGQGAFGFSSSAVPQFTGFASTPSRFGAPTGTPPSTPTATGATQGAMLGGGAGAQERGFAYREPSNLDAMPRFGSAWGTSLDRAPVRTNARGPRSMARFNAMQRASRGASRRDDYGGYD